MLPIAIAVIVIILTIVWYRWSLQKKSTELTATELTVSDKPWRDTPLRWTDAGELELLQRVRNFTLQGLPVQKACILMIGQIKAGKTSHICSYNTVLLRAVARVGNVGEGPTSVTKWYRIYQPQNEDGLPAVNFEFGDTMGFEHAGLAGISDTDITHLIKGRIARNYMFVSDSPINQNSPLYVANPGLGERPHVVAIIIDSNTVNTLHGHQWQKYRYIRSVTEMADLSLMVVLTKIDMICPQCSQDLSKVFHSRKVKAAVSKVSFEIGVAENSILPVSNYYKETHMATNKNILILETLDQLLTQAKVYLRKKVDEQQ